jgi:hypothetical protein
MKHIILFFALAYTLWACQQRENHDHAGHDHAHEKHEKPKANPDTTKGSPHRMAMANVGKAHVHIEYNAPAVRKRVIWGGLVPYGEVWVTGAHKATFISFSQDVEIAGKVIKKGKYGFFTIPNEKEWTLILNKNWKQHLTDEYTPKEDILRWKVTPEAHAHTERLAYQVIAEENKAGKVVFLWEKVKISFDVKQAN